VHRDHVDPVRRFLVEVEQDHPRPRAEHEPGGRPSATQLRTGQREDFQCSQRTGDSSPGVGRKDEGRDCLVHIPLRLRGDHCLRHSGELVERCSLSPSGLGQALLRPLPRAWNRIENFGDARGIRVSVIERCGEERSSERPLLYMRAFSELCELCRMPVIERHVDSFGRRCHLFQSTQANTARARNGGGSVRFQ
jgi:hypothetical protein